MRAKSAKRGPARMKELGMKPITIFVTEGQHKALKELAEYYGLKLASFTRACAIYFERGGKSASGVVIRFA